MKHEWQNVQCNSVVRWLVVSGCIKLAQNPNLKMITVVYLKGGMPIWGVDHSRSITCCGQRSVEYHTATSLCLRRDEGIVEMVVFLVPCTSLQTCSVGGGSGSLPACCTTWGRPSRYATWTRWYWCGPRCWDLGSGCCGSRCCACNPACRDCGMHPRSHWWP
jgi:hypothetical protein